MRNRAKCKKCGSVIESFHEFDYVDCSCGDISINGGNIRFGCSAKDWSNFLRVDDFNNEISVKVKDETGFKESPPKQTRGDILKVLDDTIKQLEDMPSTALTQPINHYDLISVLSFISSLFKADSE